MKCFVKKTLRGWDPADEQAISLHQKEKLGVVYRADIVQPRNYKHHCLFMALMELTFMNQEKYKDARMFRRAVALEAGHVEEFVTLDGEIHLIPLSYSYDDIPDEQNFTVAFGAAMTVCCRILGDLGRDELEAEVSRYANENYGMSR